MTEGPDTTAACRGQEPTAEEIRALLDELAGMDLIGMLQSVQRRWGYLPAVALREIARRTRTPLSRVYGVVSFYANFHTTPRGRRTIRACRGTACHVKGAAKVLAAIERTLGITEGQSTPDLEFYLETVACLGTCFLGPVMMIDGEYFGNLTPESVETILSSYRTGL